MGLCLYVQMPLDMTRKRWVGFPINAATTGFWGGGNQGRSCALVLCLCALIELKRALIELKRASSS